MSTTTARRGILADVACVAVLWLLCLAMLWPLVTPDAASRVYFGRGDLSDQFYAFRAFTSAQLWAGDLPLWNPGIFWGQPALADIQSSVLYPITLLSILLSGPGGPTMYALQLEILLQFWLGGLFMFLFARRATGHRGPGLLAGVVFCLGGYLTSYPPEQLPVLQTSIWLPLALLLAHRVWDAPGRRIWAAAAWVGLPLGISVIAGHPQITLLTFYTTLAYLAYGLWRGGRGRWAAAACSLAGGVGVALGAVQWLPTLELTMASSRAALPFSEAQAGFPLAEVISPLFPGFVGRFSPLYVGILPLLLALMAVAACRPPADGPAGAGDRARAIFVPFWSGAAILWFLLSFGGAMFLYSPLYLALPGYGLFRGQERLALLFTVAVAMLAAFGLAWLVLKRPVVVEGRGAGRWGKLLVCGILICGGLAAAFTTAAAGADEGNRAVLSFLRDRSLHAGAFFVLSVGLLASRTRALLNPAVLVAAALIITSADLMITDRPAHVSAADPTAAFAQYPAITKFLQSQPAPFRVHNDKVLPENFGAVAGLAAVQGNSPLRIKISQELETAVDAWRFWQLADVQYVISRRDPGAAATLVMRDGDAGLYRLAGPRAAWVVGRVALAANDVEALAMLQAPAFDPYDEAVVRDPGLPALDGKAGAASITISRPQYVAVQAEASGRSLLVVSEVYYPGWRARVDGQNSPIYRVDHALRGVLLEAGSHRVELIYQPVTLWLGAALSGLAALALAGLLLWGRG